MNTWSLWWETLTWKLEESWVGKQRMQGLVSSTLTRRPWRCHGAGHLGSFFVLGLLEAQTGMAGQVSTIGAGIGAGVECPPASLQLLHIVEQTWHPLELHWWGAGYLGNVFLQMHTLLCLFLIISPCYALELGLSWGSFPSTSLVGAQRVLLWFIPFNLVADPSPPCVCRENAFHFAFNFHAVLLTHLEEVQCSACLFCLLSLIWFAF